MRRNETVTAAIVYKEVSMKTHVKVHLSLILLGLFTLVTGCAFGTRNVTLVYPPEQSAKDLGPKVAEASTTPTETPQPIILLQFADQRSDKRVIGEVRNAYGMRTADVMAENNVAEWVTRALAAELEKAGYKVMKAEGGITPPTAPVLSGDVLTVYCTALWSYEGEVSFFAEVAKDGKGILKKRYTGKGSVGLNWTASASSYGASLSLALANAIGSFVSDLNAIFFTVLR